MVVWYDLWMVRLIMLFLAWNQRSRGNIVVLLTM